MKLNEYQDLAMRTNGTTRVPLRIGALREKPNPDLNETLTNAVLGLNGESGELADDVKKAIFHGKPFDRDHAIKELGDVLWYVAQAATGLDITLEEVARLNVDKLKKRYPEGFSHAASAERVDTRI